MRKKHEHLKKGANNQTPTEQLDKKNIEQARLRIIEVYTVKTRHKLPAMPRKAERSAQRTLL